MPYVFKNGLFLFPQKVHLRWVEHLSRLPTYGLRHLLGLQPLLDHQLVNVQGRLLLRKTLKIKKFVHVFHKLFFNFFALLFLSPAGHVSLPGQLMVLVMAAEGPEDIAADLLVDLELHKKGAAVGLGFL